jgi:hypothetical protein
MQHVGVVPTVAAGDKKFLGDLFFAAKQRYSASE